VLEEANQEGFLSMKKMDRGKGRGVVAGHTRAKEEGTYTGRRLEEGQKKRGNTQKKEARVRNPTEVRPISKLKTRGEEGEIETRLHLKRERERYNPQPRERGRSARERRRK